MTRYIHDAKGTGIVVRGDDIDTDRIIPARYLREITFARMGEYAFYDERFKEDGKKKEHPFNNERFEGASSLIVNDNFGCGSSREHAPQALMRWGIKAIVGESFAEIFAGNCTMLGIPVVTLPHDGIKKLMDSIEHDPSVEIAVNLDDGIVKYGKNEVAFAADESARKALIEGTWDSTSLLLSAKEQILEKGKALPYITDFDA